MEGVCVGVECVSMYVCTCECVWVWEYGCVGDGVTEKHVMNVCECVCVC